jgi:hypothetical protein
LIPKPSSIPSVIGWDPQKVMLLATPALVASWAAVGPCVDPVWAAPLALVELADEEVELELLELPQPAAISATDVRINGAIRRLRAGRSLALS